MQLGARPCAVAGLRSSRSFGLRSSRAGLAAATSRAPLTKCASNSQRPVLFAKASPGNRLSSLGSQQGRDLEHVEETSQRLGFPPFEAAGGAAALAASLAALLYASPALASSNALDAAASIASGSPEGFQQGFVEAFLLIFFSEIGDKTFFIAVLLSLQQPRSVVFTGTFGALAVMTVISVGLGRILHVADEALPFQSDVPWDDYLAVALLVFFGLKTIADANTPKAEEEEEGAKEMVGAMSIDGIGSTAMVASTFALVFAAEWGDKSFLATIALSAASDPAGVVAGAAAGHGVATAIAVAGGSMLGQYVSEQVMGYVGGSLFLLFAAATAAELIAGK